MDELTTTQGIVALVAAGTALVALLLGLVLAFKLRRLRRAQRAVLGDSGQRDLVAHGATLENAFVELRDWVEETAAGLERRMAAAEGRLDGCLAHTSLVRYDAYGEMSGEQSSSMALLDARRSGLVVSSILHRDQARVYVKRLDQGQSAHELSPEEQQAIETAMAAPAGTPAGA